MEEIEFKLRGKVVRMARLLKGLSVQEFARIAGIHPNTIAKIEREERSTSRLSEIRILRALRELNVSDSQLVALQLIVEHDEGKFDE